MSAENLAHSPFRIGLHIWPGEAYYVHLNEAISRRLGESHVPLGIVDPHIDLSPNEQASLAEDILASGLDALICLGLPQAVLLRLLEASLPIIYLYEIDIEHPLITSPFGLYEAGRVAGEFLASQLSGSGHVLIVDGYMPQYPQGSHSRLAGIDAVLAGLPDVSTERVTAPWRYLEALRSLRTSMPVLNRRPTALVGVSDVLALAALEAGRGAGVLSECTVSVGIHGDPEAFAAVAEGVLGATVDTQVEVFAAQAVELAAAAVAGRPLPKHYELQPRLVTGENVARVAAAELRALASIASGQVGVNRRAEQARLVQLETSSAINSHMAALLDPQQLDEELAGLIRDNYNYDSVRLWRWQPDIQQLTAEGIAPVYAGGVATFDEALRSGRPVAVSDMAHSLRFPPEPRWGDTRSHVVLPIRLGDTVLGLLDLRSQKVRPGLGIELVGLQALADHLATALRNAELYGEALRARTAAEKADQLKSRLLANVSHELRAPLNVILGYTGAALSEPGPYQNPVPAELRGDLAHIFNSGEHLMRLINDLLDLSRAEIGELELFTEPVPVRALLEEAFLGMAGSGLAQPSVAWELRLPEHLPMLQADPVRLRQILLNLLSNAAKFTAGGRIVLTADVRTPYLHIAVTDTGPGIPEGEQEIIFRPFVTLERYGSRSQGIGLGLSITRRLVALHGGYLSVDSRPGEGATFHVYLPLPSLAGSPGATASQNLVRILLISGRKQAPESVLELAGLRGAEIAQIRAEDDLEKILEGGWPTMLAWDHSEATPGDWVLIEKLRNHPYLARLPFLLFGAAKGQGGTKMPGATNVLLKAASSGVLIEAIRALRPPDATGVVLVVDDDPEARTLYRRLLAETLPAQDIREAENGQAALECLAVEIPALVILDLVMPGVDGFAVLEKIRADRRTVHVPVLVLSGKQLSLADIRRLDYGHVTVQRKGLLSDEELVGLLRKVFSGQDILPQPTSTVVKQVLAYLQESYARRLSRAEIASAVGVSESHLSRVFRQEIGLTPWDFLLRLRLQHARELLTTSSESITEVAARTGFDDPAYFSRVFAREVGQSPQIYRKQRTAPSEA